MTLDPRAKRLLDILALSAPSDGPRQSAAERRESFAKLIQTAARPVAIVRSIDRIIAAPGRDIPIRIYDDVAKRESLAGGLVFFHGGGLVAGSIETHDGICRRLAKAAGVIVVSVGYRLAPEARFPAALEDAAFIVKWVSEWPAETGIDPARLAIGGDSAGAMLAVLIADEARQIGLSFKAQLLLCPVLDLIGEMQSRKDFAKGFLIGSETVQRDIEDCLGPDAGTSDPRFSPLRNANLKAMPQSIIHTAEYDAFRDEGEAFAWRLAAAGVDAKLTRHAGMLHSFYGLPGLFPQADTALEAAGAELARILG